MANPYGDIELDAQGMRALAHPVRLAILTRLQSDGPSTATALSEHVGATPSVASWHLRHLAKHGLVRDSAKQGSGRERWWEAAARGIRFAATDDASRAAYDALRTTMEAAEGDLVGDWQRDVEPQLEPEWGEVSGRSNTTVLVTAQEAAEVEAEIERLLAPYVLRKDSPGEAPDGARTVRILRYTMPEGPSDEH